MNKKQSKAIETLEAIGQTDEHKGIKWTKFFMDKWNRKEMEKNQLTADAMRKKRGTKKKYYRFIAVVLNEAFEEMDKPSNKWRIGAYSTDKGVVVQLKGIMGRIFQRAITPCGTPKIDLNAMMQLVGSAEDTMYNIETKGEVDLKTKGGIFLK